MALWFYRLAPGLRLPARWWEPDMASAQAEVPTYGDPLHVEIVSHCWNYSHLLAYQLSSLVLAPPQKCTVTMTVCYCEEDQATVDLLAFFGQKTVPHVRWQWLPLRREQLMRRAIGRNHAGRASTADWVWFTDCDLLFHQGCLDRLAEALSGRNDPLVFPREERCTPMLKPTDQLLQAAARNPQIVDIEAERFEIEWPRKATGPLQILRGDLARRFGYCNAIRCYQTPTDRWRKTYEDRAFRWLLGTAGTAIDVPGVYRIKHVEKGRYHGAGAITKLRSSIRQAKDGTATHAS
jgi:hypothetical protein